MDELIIFNGRFSHRYYLNGKEIDLEDLVVMRAKDLKVEIKREGDGHEIGRH
jgi:hypothetical protein